MEGLAGLEVEAPSRPGVGPLGTKGRSASPCPSIISVGPDFQLWRCPYASLAGGSRKYQHQKPGSSGSERPWGCPWRCGKVPVTSICELGLDEQKVREAALAQGRNPD